MNTKTKQIDEWNCCIIAFINCIEMINDKEEFYKLTGVNYSCFIHYIDEGFALLVLENNISRYREMRDRAFQSNQQTEDNEDEEDEYEYTQ